MLSDDQVEKFIEEKLGIWDWNEHLAESKLDFLTTLFRRYRQNSFMVAKPPEERRGPTIDDVVYQATETPGGVCMNLNFFMKMILDHLGYSVDLVGARCVSVDLPNNHILLNVHLPNPDDSDEEMYLIDVGFPWPTGGPINLKQLPYEFKAGGFKIRYEFNEADSIYRRVLIGGDPINNEFDDENEERVDVLFDLTPLTFDDFADTMHVIFTDVERCFMLNTTLLFRYVTLEDENNFQYACCLGRKIILGTTTRRVIHTYETYTEMVPDILKYFPQLDLDNVSKACEFYQSRH